MTTKEQERKALAQIRKIVEGLGEGSYVWTAMEGMLQDAEDNIEYDAAFSMQDRWESAEKRFTQLQKTYNEQMSRMAEQVRKLEGERDQEIKNRQAYAAEAQKQASRAAELEEMLETETEACDLRRDEAYTLREEVEKKDQEIMRLKARLFDLMNK